MKGEVADAATRSGVQCASELTFRAIEGLPRVLPGDDVAALLIRALEQHAGGVQHHDVIVVTSKIISKAENQLVDLATVTPSARALELAEVTGTDPRALEVVLWDTEKISRSAKGALIVRHHGGHVSANAGLDQSNAQPSSAAAGSGPWVLRLPADADASAGALRERLERHFDTQLAVIVSDSFGRPFRVGTVGVAIGVSGLSPLFDQRGRLDLFGRALEHTISATADQLCAAADLVCGQAAEGRPAVLVRGLRFEPFAGEHAARALCRKLGEDLYL
jgi:coenzyme F420-0:L-glutamate ligase / coenzyme F420-1:gamma-L-glutamate ligase